jgi:hypothetical protein
MPRPRQMTKGAGIVDLAGFAADRFIPGSGPLARKLADNGLAVARQFIRRIRGSGDYTIGEDTPKYNVLLNNDQVPRFVGGARSFTVAHREYIGMVQSSDFVGKFDMQRYRINPANSAVFPWLSKLATSYQKYKFHGLAFEYRTMSGPISGSTNTALGTVALAFSPNPAEPPPADKVDMELYEGVVSVKPSNSALCAVECADEGRQFNTMQVQPAVTATGADLILGANREVLVPFQTDWGQLWVSTNGVQGAGVQLGELWVTYSVEFFGQRQDHFSTLRQLTRAYNIPVGVNTGAGSIAFDRSLGGITHDVALDGGDMKHTIVFPPALAGAMFTIHLRNFFPGGAGSFTGVTIIGPTIDNGNFVECSVMENRGNFWDSWATGLNRWFDAELHVDLRQADALNPSTVQITLNSTTNIVSAQGVYVNIMEMNTPLMATIALAD